MESRGLTQKHAILHAPGLERPRLPFCRSSQLSGAWAAIPQSKPGVSPLTTIAPQTIKYIVVVFVAVIKMIPSGHVFFAAFPYSVCCVREMHGSGSSDLSYENLSNWLTLAMPPLVPIPFRFRNGNRNQKLTVLLNAMTSSRRYLTQKKIAASTETSNYFISSWVLRSVSVFGIVNTRPAHPPKIVRALSPTPHIHFSSGFM